MTDKQFIDWIESLPFGQQKIAKQLFYYYRHKNLYFSQSHIARICNLSREYVNKVLTKFEAAGVVIMQYRHKQTSRYLLSPLFNEQVRAKISYLFRAFPLVFLLSFPTTQQSSHNILRKDIINIKSRTVIRKPISACARAYEGNGLKTKNLGDGMLLPTEKKQLLVDLKNGTGKERLFSEALLSIKCASFTEAALVRLLGFPDYVIRKVDADLVGDKKARCMFSVFMLKCNTLCKEQNIRPDWSWVDSVRTVLGLTGQEIMVNKPSVPSRFSPQPQVGYGGKSIKEIRDAKEYKSDPVRSTINPEESLAGAQDHISSLSQDPKLAWLFGDLVIKG